MKHLKIILALILSLAMLFAVTAMAAEPEVETCEEGCVHDHAEDAAEMTPRGCAHEFNVTNGYTYQNIGSPIGHRMIYHVYETCRHCGYFIDNPGTSSIVAHFNEPGSNYCLLCGYTG